MTGQILPETRALGHRLLAGERILWTGTPATGLILRPYDWFYIPMSAVWTGFIVFWNGLLWYSLATALDGSHVTTPVRTPQDPWAALLVLSSFLVVGLVLLGMGYNFLIGRFISDIERRKKTFYVVTDFRAITVEREELRSYVLIQGARISTKRMRKGTGTVTFGESDPWPMQGSYGKTPPPMVFEKVTDIDELLRALKEA